MQAIKQFFKTHPHAWWGLYLPVYLASFFLIEHFITDNYWATQTVLDSYVPFCEWFIFPYASWSPLLVVLGVYLILKDGEGFRRYMWYIMVTFTTAVVFCILIPNGQDLRPAVMEHHLLHRHQHQRVPQRPHSGLHGGGGRRVAHAGAAEARVALGCDTVCRADHGVHRVRQAARGDRRAGRSADRRHRLCVRLCDRGQTP